MKQIDIDDELYQYIASNTQSIGESASTILRRLLNMSGEKQLTADVEITQNQQTTTTSAPSTAPELKHAVAEASATACFNSGAVDGADVVVVC